MNQFFAVTLLFFGIAFGQNLIPGGDLEAPGAPGFTTTGSVTYGPLAYANREHTGRGFRLSAAAPGSQGSVSTTLRNLPTGQRWYRLRVQAMAQDNFVVEKDALYLEAAFFSDAGKTSLDKIRSQIYPVVLRERVDLKDKGTSKSLGLAVWRSYDLQFRTPFPEVDTLTLSLGFQHGAGEPLLSEFRVDEMSLIAIPDPATYRPSRKNNVVVDPPAFADIQRLGGRWYYDPQGGDPTPPAQFDYRNAQQLLYRSGQLEAPFAGNMSAMMEPGFYDINGALVTERREVKDNLVITFTKTHMVMKSRGLPNHPTAIFPDRWRALDGNPNYLQEQDVTYYIPLEPQRHPNPVAMEDETNNNRALPGGPVGIAVNGVVFFNPFDHLLDEDAVWRLDRCCGHPAPSKQYHYHKYPVCVKSPWSDDGSGHSPLIGFSFDGYPVYGPYEGAGELALKAENELNEFNVHSDDARGWHYHVTPGRFPHILGGYWGQADPKNQRRRGGPAGGGPPRGGLRPGGR